MYDKTRYWITPAGELIDVSDDHQRLLKRLTGLSKDEALRAGWIRVIRDDRFGAYWYFEIQSPYDERGLELIEQFVLSPENPLTDDPVAASISTNEPKTGAGSFPVEWRDLEEMSFVEAALRSFKREARRPEGYRWYELRGSSRGPRWRR